MFFLRRRNSIPDLFPVRAFTHTLMEKSWPVIPLGRTGVRYAVSIFQGRGASPPFRKNPAHLEE